MSHIVRIKPCNQTIVVEEDETVLDAALRNDIDFPFSCMSAICTTCLGKLLHGEISYLSEEPYGLEDLEPNQGYTLFCSAVPKSDLIIEVTDVITDDDYPIRSINYMARHIEPLNKQTYRVILASSDTKKIKYRPGQYVELTNSNSQTAPFSIANAPSEKGELELHVQTGTEFSNKLINDLNQEKTVTATGPHGHNVYQSQPLFPILLVAGGVGISHSMAIIQYAAELHFPRPIHLYWGCKKIDDFYLMRELNELANEHKHFQFTPILSEADHNWQGQTGLIHPAIIRDYPDLTNIEIHASGSEAMITTIFDALKPLGLRKVLMHSDLPDKDPS